MAEKMTVLNVRMSESEKDKIKERLIKWIFLLVHTLEKFY